MNFTFEDLKSLRSEGYTDEQMASVLFENDKELGDVFKEGYTLDQIISVTSNRPIPQEPEPEPSGFLRQAADIPIKVGEGFVGSVKSFADLFGADNPVSKELAGYEEWIGGLVSAESKQDSKEIARILKDAEDKGVYDKVIAGLEAFSKAPLEMSAQSVGYMIPQLAAGVLGKAAQLTKAGIIGTQAAIGFAQGVGMIKGDIYTATTDYLREKGVPEDQIDPIATKAQSYGGGNLDQMLIGGGLLAVDAITGADAILTRVLTKQGKPVNDGIIKGIIKGGLKEGAIEVPQEGQEQVAANVALQREGYDVPTYEGAIQRAAVGGFAGFAMGSVLGGFESMSPERKAEIKIDEAAEQAARDLETPSDNPAAMALSTEITRNQDAIENLRLDLDAMEPNDPRANKLRFDISDRQKALTDLQLLYQKVTGNDQEIPAVSIAASKRMELDNKIESLTEEIGMDEEALATMAEGSQERIDAQTALDKKKTDLDAVNKEVEGLSLTIKPPVAEAATPSTTIEEAKTKIEGLNTEFDALDENDKAGIDRVNTQIFAEQNKIAELTAIKQGIDPQGTTPTREKELPPSGRTTTPKRPRMLAGEFYEDRPILQAFMSATDKAVGRIPVFSKRAQKLKNAIRTGIANNAGFLAGTNTKVITSEDFGKLTGRKQVAADTGTYKAVFVKGQKYLVVPDINQLAGISIRGEQTSTSRDAAIDQESRAAAKKLEEEVIHLSMFQGIQDEYKALKNPKLSEQEYVVKRLSDIVKEVKRTNPNALPGVSNAYLNDKSRLLDDLTFSQEFMRMVIQRVRTGQITEDLNAIRQAEKETFSDQDKGAIISLKNSILNALRVVRDSITRYLGKGTSTKEVEKMLNTMNTLLDEYGIVKGKSNYEFKDYSAAQPKGELKAEPTEEAMASVETPATPSKSGQLAIDKINSRLSEMITPTIEARAGVTPNLFTQENASKNREVLAKRFEKFAPQVGVEGLVRGWQRPSDGKFIRVDEHYSFWRTGDGEILGDPTTIGYVRIVKEGKTLMAEGNPNPKQLKELKDAAIEQGLELFAEKSYYPIEAKAGVTPQMDVDYLTAVESGDMETAQRMVDEAAKKAGYIHQGLRHGSGARFTQFLQSFRGTAAGGISSQEAFFLTDSERTAKRYAVYAAEEGPVKQLMRKAEEAESQGDWDSYEKFIAQAEDMTYGEEGATASFERRKNAVVYNLFARGKFMSVDAGGKTAEEFGSLTLKINEARKKGIDGVIFKNLDDAPNLNDPSTHYAVFAAENIKSADPVTYDEQGNVIPLSERFDVTSPLIARAGETPQPSARSVKIEKKITQQIINDIEGLINDLKPKKDKSGQPYVSRTTLKGKTYAYSLVSPFSKAVDLYKMTGHEMALSAFNKVLKGNPDASFFDIASNLTLRDENGESVVTYGLSKEELANLIPLFNKVAPTYRQMVMDSNASFLDRSRIALSMPAIEFGLSKAVVKIMQAAGRTLNLAKTLRQMGGYGMAVANYKSNVQKSIGNLWSKIGGDMNDIASYARGDRRKAVDSVASLSKVISKLVSLQKMAIKNPEKARDSIRKAISRKQTTETKKILLEFSASTFDDKTEKFANMIIDETAKAILSIGTKKGSSNTDSTYKKIYKAISIVAKQTAQEEETRKQEQEGKPKEKKQVAKREGKFLEQVGMVIGNDKTYKQFMDEVRNSIRQEYQSDAEFNAEYKGLFDMLSNREWSESMRQQAIKDSADALDYKFAELFQYIGSQRNAAQESVKTHMRFELQSMGATAEMVDKFTADVDNYLNEETRKVLEKKLGFVVDKETGKITGGQIIKDKMKELSTTDGQFKIAKTLKGLTRLAASDQRNFIDQLNELMITELGFDDKASAELSKIIEDEITKAVIAQQSQNLKQAIARVTKTLDDNNITAKGTTQRTILKRLIELANMGQLDDMKVYEAFRQTHNFGKGYLEYNPDMVQTLREWGDRISALPEGVMRGIEEQKMGRYMLEQGVFTTTDYLSSYWYFALLSQVGTQAINVMSSTFNLMGNIATWGLYTKGKSLGPMMRGLSRAISGKQSPASNSFLYVMQTGLNPSGLQDEKMMIYPKGNVFENSTPENVPKLVHKLITFGADSVQSPALNAILNTMSPRGMMRLMRASDAYMREVAYEVRAASLGAAEFSQEQYDAAFRQAEAEMQGSKSATREKKKEIIIRTNEIIAEQRLEVREREYAEQDSLEVVYSQKNAGLLGLITSFANKMLDQYPASRLFIPFTNVVANVLNENLNYAPLISQYRLMRAVELSPLLKGKIKLRPGTEKNPFIQGREDKAANLAIKSIIGLGASAIPFIIGAIAGGDDEDQDKERPFVQFYSQGPKDPEQNKIWTENGGTKYSIRFGNTYISYLFTPLVIPLSYGQMLKQEVDTFQKKAGEKGIGDVTELSFKVLASPVAIGFVAALDQSFLTGISDLIELKEARDLPKAGAGIARNIISRMLVPGVARDMQKLMVDERLEGDLYITNMLKEFPGSSAFLDKDLNYFGDKARYNSIMQEDGFTRRAFSLVGRIAATEKPDPAFEILYKNGITPPNWSQSLQWMDKTPMTKAEQREFIASAGPRMKQFIIDNESTISMLDTESAQKFVSDNFSAIRRGTKGMMEFNRTK
jgi:hypothetical protein